MNDKEKAVVKELLDDDSAMVVALLRLWERLDDILGTEKTDELMYEVDQVILSMITHYPLEWRQNL